MTLEQIEAAIASLGKAPRSPYKAAKAFNEAFGTDLPPQMFYNYVKKGYIAVSTNNTGKLVVAGEELARFALKYATAHLLEEEVQA